MRPQILRMGLADERERDGLDAAVREHLDNPVTVMMPHLIFLAWAARKPLRDHRAVGVQSPACIPPSHRPVAADEAPAARPSPYREITKGTRLRE
jgi:hypothetical protein